MPELPEVETIVSELRTLIMGKTIGKIILSWPPTVESDPDIFTSTLTNKKIVRIERRGKYICFYFNDGQCLTIHLRMTGKLIFMPDEKDKKYIRLIFEFTDLSSLYFVDVRKFGRMKLWSNKEPLLPHLGAEPLKEKMIFQALANLKSRRAIKTVLLDQEVLSGVGNIYADEVLFMAGIHPLTPAARISEGQLKKLSRHLPQILNTAIRKKGTTFSNFRRTDQSIGEYQFVLNVYGRTGEPCNTCQTPINRIRINSRSSHFCPKCQPTV